MDTLERGVEAERGTVAPLQVLMDQNRFIQVNLAKSFWRGVGDIKVTQGIHF